MTSKKTMTILGLVFSCTIITFCLSNCNTNTTAQSIPPTKLPPTQNLYVWVSAVNVRQSPQLDAPILQELHQGDRVIWSQKKSKKAFQINFKGKNHNAPFYKIKTTQNIEGWIYSAALHDKQLKPLHKIVVGKKLAFSTLQDAIESAMAHDTILIQSGQYFVNKAILIDVPHLTIIGENNVEIIGTNPREDIINIQNSHLTFQNISLKHKAHNPIHGNAFTIINQKNIKIHNCKISNNRVGLFIKNSHDIFITDNEIKEQYFTPIQFNNIEIWDNENNIKEINCLNNQLSKQPQGFNDIVSID